jgi:hypothetical protein
LPRFWLWLPGAGKPPSRFFGDAAGGGPEGVFSEFVTCVPGERFFVVLMAGILRKRQQYCVFHQETTLNATVDNDFGEQEYRHKRDVKELSTVFTILKNAEKLCSMKISKSFQRQFDSR